MTELKGMKDLLLKRRGWKCKVGRVHREEFDDLSAMRLRQEKATEVVAILSKAVFTRATGRASDVLSVGQLPGKLVRSQRVSRQLKQKWEFYITLEGRLSYLISSALIS